MLEELLSIGYDARLPVDEFLAMEFQLHCAVCNILVNDSMVYIGVFRPPGILSAIRPDSSRRPTRRFSGFAG